MDGKSVLGKMFGWNHAFKLIANQLNFVSPEVQKGQGGGTLSKFIRCSSAFPD